MEIVIESRSRLSREMFVEMLAEADARGHKCVRRLVDEWESGRNRFCRENEALFVARDEDRIIGVCGLNIDPYQPAQTVGRVRHLYVIEAYRRCGIGRQLVERVIEEARGRFTMLRLRTNSPEAAAFYARIGFARADGVENCSHAMTL